MTINVMRARYLARLADEIEHAPPASEDPCPVCQIRECVSHGLCSPCFIQHRCVVDSRSDRRPLTEDLIAFEQQWAASEERRLKHRQQAMKCRCKKKEGPSHAARDRVEKIILDVLREHDGSAHMSLIVGACRSHIEIAPALAHLEAEGQIVSVGSTPIWALGNASKRNAAE